MRQRQRERDGQTWLSEGECVRQRERDGQTWLAEGECV